MEEAVLLRRALLVLGFSPVGQFYAFNTTEDYCFLAIASQNCFAVLHFLFSALDPTRAKQEFQHCYPVLSKPQRDTFSESALRWLQELEKQRVVPQGTASKTALKECCGPK